MTAACLHCATIGNKRYARMPTNNPDHVYIGRPTRWGNPYPVRCECHLTANCEHRLASVANHRQHLWQQIKRGEVTLEDLAALHNKKLWCFCAPLACHGDNLRAAAHWAYEQLQAQKTTAE